jgi:hypothetical protein
MQQAALCVGIEGLSLAIFTRSLQWPIEKLYEFLAEVREDLANCKNQLYLPWYAGPKHDILTRADLCF